MSDLSP